MFYSTIIIPRSAYPQPLVLLVLVARRGEATSLQVLNTRQQTADSSHHDSDEADYPNADNEGSDLDTILPDVLVPMDDDCAVLPLTMAIHH